LIAVSHDVRLAELFPNHFYQLATGSMPVVACPAIHYALPDDRVKFDIIQSVRKLTLLRQEHPEKRMDGRFHFRNRVQRTPGLAHALARNCGTLQF
jgi:hypothetical protein